MFFIFKRKKIILDCFTSIPNILNHTPIDYAEKFIPEWWKLTPKNYEGKFYKTSTIKKCNGIIDFYKNGFIIPMWSDLSININEDKSVEWQFADNQSEIGSHDSKQWNYFANPNDVINFKIYGQWKIKTKSDIDFLIINDFWNNSLFNNYEICSGIIKFKYSHETNINLMLNLKNKTNIFIKHNTPLIHIFPLSENKIELRTHLLSTDDYNKMSVPFVFDGIYKTLKKCPFH